ncbi:MAG TPA: ADP-ribosylglycohydrolase family protein [Isosphaeraceae bacterium]|jgi:ADP-ribosylglycohydrolase
MPSRQDRIEGGLVGLLVGDALGVPYEFHAPGEIPPLEAIEFDPPPGFRRAHASVPPGTWSDDGAQALCLLASLRECGRLDPEDLGRRLLAWYDDGYLAVDGRVFDVGIQTGRALRALRSGVPALEAGPNLERDNGNGSLMRVLPLALWHRGPDAELVADACAQSRVTHGHPRSQVCCALYCLWARRTLDDVSDPWSAAVVALRGLLGTESPLRHELEGSIRPDDPPDGRGSGYVVDCLRSARLVVGVGAYEQVVQAAVALGHDTDTTAAVAGGIAGLRDGWGAIPERWRAGLRGRELYEPLLIALRERGV